MELLQVAQRAVDLDRAVAFYERLLGEPPVARFDPPGLAFFVVGGVRLLLDGAAPSCLLYLRVDDLDGTVDRLRRQGVEVVTDPHVIFTHEDDRLGPRGTDERMAFIKDSEGNTVALVSHVTAR